jgi:16S rRNA (uracil1498-N3)-methyltransferase
VQVGRDSLAVRILARRQVPAPKPLVTLAQALVKGERGELAVELATEAGVDAVLPWRAARCVARWDEGPRGAKGLARWRGTVLASAKQSRRAWVPEVGDPVSTEQLAARCTGADVALVLHEAAELPLAGLAGELATARHVLLVVGPEGGITEGELGQLAAAGARPVRLGPQVLRASTAAAVALGALGVLTDRWDAAENMPTETVQCPESAPLE